MKLCDREMFRPRVPSTVSNRERGGTALVVSGAESMLCPYYGNCNRAPPTYLFVVFLPQTLCCIYTHKNFPKTRSIRPEQCWVFSSAMRGRDGIAANWKHATN